MAWLRKAIVLMVLGLVVGGGSVAQAGGYTYLDWPDQHLVVGQTAKAHDADVSVNGSPGSLRWDVYLFHGNRGGDRLPATAIRVGSANVSGGGNGLAAVNVSFVVPDVPTGTYQIRVCDPGCHRTLGDLTDSTVYIADSVAVSQLQRKALRLGEVERRLERVGRDRDELQRQVDRLEAAGAEPATGAAPTRVVREDTGSGTSWFLLIVAFVAGLGAALLGSRLARKRRRSPRFVEFEAPSAPSHRSRAGKGNGT